jgi:Abnormal spindle-like microcephaly-assoc'd, ASPM-SPD-2-Hydin
MTLKSTELRKRTDRSRRNVGRLWQHRVLPAILLLGPTLLLIGCAGLVSAGGTKSQAAIQVTPSSFNFGNLVVGKKVSQTATVLNTGNTSINVTAASVSSGQFAVSGITMPLSLPVGQSSTFQVWFDPGAAGTITGTLTIQTDNGVSGQVALTGVATTTPQQISLSSTTLNLGSTTVGTTLNGSLTLTNTGGANLIISLISVNGGPFGVSGITTPSTIVPGGSATMNVSFTPTTGGSDSGSISITSNDPNSPTTTVTLSGTATSSTVTPTITTQPVSQTVTAGQTATFGVLAGGTSPLSYQWQKNGVNIAGATLASYTTPVTATTDSGSTFDVKVSNTAGSVTSSAATLTVSAAVVAPTITTQPASQTVTAGQAATFGVVAGGTVPLSYQWQKNGVNIAGATAASYTTPATATPDSGSTFKVVVSNTAGTVTSVAATLTVNAAAVAPSITTQPASQTLTAGQTATFTVVAGGTAPLSYQWQKNGVNLVGATAASYTTPATTTTDSGSTFAVVVSNTAGTATSARATLTVNAAAVAPTITTQPASQTVTAGQTATFTVVAGGTAPLSYQWQKNGANIAGATAANYTTPATATSDSGSTFRVVVNNTAGTVTSAAASLTVNPAPVPGIQLSSSSINFGNDVVGSNSSQALIITNTGTATLTIAQVTETGAAFGISGFSLPLNVNVGQQTIITVAFRPTSVGAVSGNISILSNAPSSPTAVGLTGTGIAATLTLGISPASLSFGNVTTGTTSASQNVTITNTGNANVTISQMSVSGAGYTATGGGTPVTLTPTQTLTLVTQFSPTVAGSVSGSILIASNASGSPATVSITGTGIAPVQHSVALSWTASTSVVSGYNVYRGTVSGGPYTKINSSLVATLNYTDSTVQSGTTYYYVTTAVDSSGSESVYSNEVPASIP